MQYYSWHMRCTLKTYTYTCPQELKLNISYNGTAYKCYAILQLAEYISRAYKILHSKTIYIKVWIKPAMQYDNLHIRCSSTAYKNVA